jgi:hypothetical protein
MLFVIHSKPYFTNWIKRNFIVYLTLYKMSYWKGKQHKQFRLSKTVEFDSADVSQKLNEKKKWRDYSSKLVESVLK